MSRVLPGTTPYVTAQARVDLTLAAVIAHQEENAVPYGGVHLHAMHTRRAIAAAHDPLRVWLSCKRWTSGWPAGASGAITMDRLCRD
jgi:hypothetical protein